LRKFRTKQITLKVATNINTYKGTYSSDKDTKNFSEIEFTFLEKIKIKFECKIFIF